MAEKDFLEKQFNEWYVIERVGTDLYKCKCVECGEEKEIRGYYLKNKPPKSVCKKNDILHKHFGELEVIEKLDNGMVKCRCYCKNIKIVHRRYLQNGTVTSCGHDKVGETSKLIDITGKEFGDWKVLSYYGNKLWNCKCRKCGRDRKIRGHELRGKDIPTCICTKVGIQREQLFNELGVYALKQLNSSRTPQQIETLGSKEKLQAYIVNNFRNKPTIREIAMLLGIDQPSVLRFVRKYALENLVQIGVYRSHYETDINKMFPCSNIGDRSILNGKEIDLYYAQKKVGIEFNGNYWHSEMQKDKSYHINKSLMAAQKGVRLIHIFEYEWNNEETQRKIIKLLEKILTENKLKRVYAKECDIKQINSNDATEFLNKYHLQKSAKSSVQYGCFFSNELIGVMTFGKPRFNTNHQYELIRLCWKDDIAVIGGAEKLFKNFIDDYKPSNIISYCDISKFSGNVYTKLGFKLEGIAEPNYKWVDMSSQKILTRYQTQKRTLIERGLGTEDQTEEEIMHNLGYLRVYDCGNYKFIWESGK